MTQYTETIDGLSSIHTKCDPTWPIRVQYVARIPTGWKKMDCSMTRTSSWVLILSFWPLPHTSAYALKHNKRKKLQKNKNCKAKPTVFWIKKKRKKPQEFYHQLKWALNPLGHRLVPVYGLVAPPLIPGCIAPSKPSFTCVCGHSPLPTLMPGVAYQINSNAGFSCNVNPTA